MIPKITKGSNFGGLVDYLVIDRDHEVLDFQGVSCVDMAAAEMAAIASQNSRAKVTLLHLSLSAAIEDGRLNKAQWLRAVDEMEAAAGLVGHPRVVVRHRDKGYDHIHVFWCTISPETGMTPAKSWFLKKSSEADYGPHILTAEQVRLVPLKERALRTYDFRLQARLQDRARDLEAAMGLRQLRSPQQAKNDRLKGETDRQASHQSKLSERTGDRNLMAFAEDIRASLSRSSWDEREESLRSLNLAIEPVIRTTRDGEQLRGIVVVDRLNPKNRIKASAFDIGKHRYGLAALERSLAPNASRFKEWSKTLSPTSSRGSVQDTSALKAGYAFMIEQHREAENAKRRKRAELRKRHAAELKRLRAQLMAKRRAMAKDLPSNERRAFYREFAVAARGPAIAELRAQQKEEMRSFKRRRLKTFTEFAASNIPELPKQKTVQISPIKEKLASHPSAGSKGETSEKASPSPSRQIEPVDEVAAEKEKDGDDIPLDVLRDFQRLLGQSKGL